jgi:hypothetical protein
MTSPNTVAYEGHRRFIAEISRLFCRAVSALQFNSAHIQQNYEGHSYMAEGVSCVFQHQRQALFNKILRTAGRSQAHEGCQSMMLRFQVKAVDV